jgi:signal peptidase I
MFKNKKNAENKDIVDNENELTPKQKTTKEFREFFRSTFIAIVITMLFVAFVAQVGVVKGESMVPTFQNGEKILIWKLSKEFERNDIIVFTTNDIKQGDFIKRVIATPGETIQIIDNDIYINGKKIEDKINVVMDSYGIAENPILLKDGEYFVMGDNRNNSMDSRDKRVGIINISSIRGKVILRFVPWTTF